MTFKSRRFLNLLIEKHSWIQFCHFLSLLGKFWHFYKVHFSKNSVVKLDFRFQCCLKFFVIHSDEIIYLVFHQYYWYVFWLFPFHLLYYVTLSKKFHLITHLICIFYPRMSKSEPEIGFESLMCLGPSTETRHWFLNVLTAQEFF